jgi:hypothetical protein
VQYLRYIFPAISLLGVVAVAVMSNGPWQRLRVLAVILLVLVQCGLVRTTNWIIAAGSVEHMLSEGPGSLPDMERKFAPERQAIKNLVRSETNVCLLLAEPSTSYVALAPGQSLATSWYDPRMNALAESANLDSSGKAWVELLGRIGITHIEYRPDQANPGMKVALDQLGYVPVVWAGNAQILNNPNADGNRCMIGVINPRNEAKRLLSK